MRLLEKTVRGLIEKGISCPLVLDLTYEKDMALGPSLLIGLERIYHDFWLMGISSLELNNYCASCVDPALFAQLPPFEVSNDYLGFGGIFSSDPPVLEDFEEYRAVLYQPHSSCRIEPRLYAQAIAATLAVLFTKSEFYPVPQSEEPPKQLFYARSGTKLGGGGYFLSPVLSSQVIQFIAEHSDQVCENALNAMMRTWSALNDGREAKRSHGFRAECNGEHFFLSVPDGSAANLSLSYGDATDKRRWQLCSHNVDSPIMQLEFLAGLGSIFAAVREQEMAEGKI